MMKRIPQNPSRRTFLKDSAAVAAFTIVPRFVLGGVGYTAPGDKIVIGMIGCGKQSHGLTREFLKSDDVKIVANADTDQQKKEAYAKIVNDHYAGEGNGTSYKGMDSYGNYMDLITRSDIDAVIIATPDHWHAIISVAAMKNGKDVYCEKPLAHTVYEGRQMVNAARKHKRILQTGSMQRSWKDFRKACELVRNGFIGKVKDIRVNVGGPAVPCDLPAEKTPEYLDWNTWLGPAKIRPYNAILSPPITFNGWPMWRSYWEFGGGGVADWGAHMFDIAQWGLGMDRSGPVKLIPPTGEDAQRGLKYIYANGVEMIHEDFGRGNAVEFNGDKGTIRVSREFLESDPANLLTADIPANGIHLYKSENHYRNWIDCIRSRKPAVCDAETGHRTATVCNIGNIAYKVKRELSWDPVKEIFAGDPEANQWLTRDFRKPFVL